MAGEWREFEKLVARIEKAMSPIGAVITSPDFLRDSVTGKLREVDASIRLQRGQPPIRVLECRDRTRVEDVIWIEQLVTKYQDHGIPTTAVSSLGFSESAVIKARHYGIETRSISEVTQDDMIDWVKITEVGHIIHFSLVETVKMELWGEAGETGGRLHRTVVDQVQAGGGDAPVFTRDPDGKAFSACQILDAAIRKGLALFNGVPYDGSKVQKQAIIECEKGLFRIHTEVGLRDLHKLILGVSVYAKKSPSPLPDKGFAYQGTGRSAAYGIETEAEVLGNSVLVSFHKQVDSAVLTVTITRHEGTK